MVLRAILMCWVMLLVGCANHGSLPPRAAIEEVGVADAVGGPAMRAHFIDVGQADATLLEFDCGAVLIDAGGDNEGDVRRLVAYLDAFFERRMDLDHTLDLLLVTHAHIDHTRGLEAVRERFTIRRYVDGGRDVGSGMKPIESFKENPRSMSITEVTDADVAALPHRRGLSNDVIDPVECEACDPKLTLLAASHERGPGPFSNENFHSLVLRVDFGEASFLFTGDLEKHGIARLLNRYRGTEMLDVDVYQAGHHGQFDGTTPELVRAMSPQAVVISCGDSSPTLDPISAYAFGVPRKGVIEMFSEHTQRDRATPRMAKVGAATRWFNDHRIQRAIYCTAWDGDIVVLAELNGRLRVVKQRP